MKLLSKLAIITMVSASSVFIGASGGGHKPVKLKTENLEDRDLNIKLLDLKHNIIQQRADETEASEMFSKVFPSAIEGSAKVKNIWFADGDTSIVITESPIPIRILFKGQFLLENDLLKDKVGKSIKFKISNLSLVKEPILPSLRVPVTDSPFWIHASFTNYGKGSDGDFVDNIKPGTIAY